MRQNILGEATHRLGQCLPRQDDGMHGNLLHPCGGNFLELINDFGAAASHSEVSNERLGKWPSDSLSHHVARAGG